MIDIDILIDNILNKKLILEKEIKIICNYIKDKFINEANIIYLESPICLVGNILGHFDDLIRIIELGGDLPETKYLFMGNIVNRGKESIECLLLLFLLKLKFPDNILILRSRNETRSISQIFGFYDEIQKKYGNSKIWYYFTEVFDYLPLAAIIDNKIFSICGGISKSIEDINNLKSFDRVTDIKKGNLFDDYFFNEPIEKLFDYKISSSEVGWNFGAKAFNDFLTKNFFDLMIIPSYYLEFGFKTFFNKRLYLLWSCSNFLNKFFNKGSFLEFLVNDFKQLIVFQIKKDEENNENESKSEESIYL